MNKHQVYFHGENHREPKFIDISPEISVEEIIVIYQREFGEGSAVEEIELFVEDVDEPRPRHHRGEEAGIRHRGHIHFHRCKRIEVIIMYNGDDKTLSFPPSTTVKRIFLKAIEAFRISEKDAGDYVLKLEDGTILQSADHIGSFTAFPKCNIKLFLTAIKPIQG